MDIDREKELYSQIEGLRSEIEHLREALGEAVTTLDLVWNHWNEVGYDSHKIGERVRAILSDSATAKEPRE